MKERPVDLERAITAHHQPQEVPQPADLREQACHKTGGVSSGIFGGPRPPALLKDEEKRPPTGGSTSQDAVMGICYYSGD